VVLRSIHRRSRDPQKPSEMEACRLPRGKIALQLSTREGFEVKVSEALHAGKPVIASRTGGIPLQIQHDKSGYLCEVGDNDQVATHLYDLHTDEKLYDAVSNFARKNASDEVSRVALSGSHVLPW